MGPAPMPHSAGVSPPVNGVHKAPERVQNGPAPHPSPLQRTAVTEAALDPKTGLPPPHIAQQRPGGAPLQPAVAPAPPRLAPLPAASQPAPPPQPAAQARPAPDFANLPPAIAESLMRLAGSLPRKSN